MGGWTELLIKLGRVSIISTLVTSFRVVVRLSPLSLPLIQISPQDREMQGGIQDGTYVQTDLYSIIGKRRTRPE
ncbi:uncharacterized protein YALI1_A19441g [Yarrowia lipolytica]|uniref:Uncharacterized protein n=1 Tax=Yarrowia lipolytica TaxID=4952 RepID=A0A1D8N5D3_YARLL|nr:hypothetical protein YALI1_A19441g [Yarrowia lipolytica]